MLLIASCTEVAVCKLLSTRTEKYELCSGYKVSRQLLKWIDNEKELASCASIWKHTLSTLK